MKFCLQSFPQNDHMMKKANEINKNGLKINVEGIVDELHRNARKNFPRRRIEVRGLDES